MVNRNGGSARTWTQFLVGTFKRLTRICLGVYLGLGLLLMAIENRLVYPASKARVGEFSAAEHGGEDVFFTAADGTKLHGWYFQFTEQPRGYLLYNHGNGTQVGYCGPRLASLAQDSNYGVLVYDYRGYGLSEGSPHQTGVFADARAARDWLVDRAQINKDQCVLVGRSLGGGVAVELAANEGAAALVLQNTFTSLPDVAARRFWFLPVRSVMRNRMNSLSKIKDYRGPLLQSHGDRDDLIPLEIGKRLFDAAHEPKELFVVTGGSHNTPHPVEYRQRLLELLDEVALLP